MYLSFFKTLYHLSAKKHGIDEVNPTVVNLISHATQEKLREYASKLSVIAEHRVEIYKVRLYNIICMHCLLFVNIVFLFLSKFSLKNCRLLGNSTSQGLCTHKSTKRYIGLKWLDLT